MLTCIKGLGTFRVLTRQGFKQALRIKALPLNALTNDTAVHWAYCLRAGEENTSLCNRTLLSSRGKSYSQRCTYRATNTFSICSGQTLRQCIEQCMTAQRTTLEQHHTRSHATTPSHPWWHWQQHYLKYHIAFIQQLYKCYLCLVDSKIGGDSDLFISSLIRLCQDKLFRS